ncbi:hypothetical protein OSB04_015628 [Centaurea solstitialis]|uniref:Uncharacterized protein n=1 Tax=Centaurea solstitialis TaxID=347529 RepID=A0AA38T782_9ASTR|nr:hypothetical protein OSB04_015628 [Centaurea solstitialis]
MDCWAFAIGWGSSDSAFAYVDVKFHVKRVNPFIKRAGLGLGFLTRADKAERSLVGAGSELVVLERSLFVFMIVSWFRVRKDVEFVWEYPEVFLVDLDSLPPDREIELQICFDSRSDAYRQSIVSACTIVSDMGKKKSFKNDSYWVQGVVVEWLVLGGHIVPTQGVVDGIPVYLGSIRRGNMRRHPSSWVDLWTGHERGHGPVTVSMVERISRVPKWIPDTSSTSVGAYTVDNIWIWGLGFLLVVYLAGQATRGIKPVIT